MKPVNTGEDALVTALLAQLSPARRRHGVYAGAGEDDCAVVKPLPASHLLLLKTDCVIDGVHFLPDTPPEQVGWKALCRPLSDIAATGGKGLHALVTLALNRERSREWAVGVYAGIGRAAARYGIAVVGGDTAATPGPSLVSVFLTGSVHRRRSVTRGGGRPGDSLYVTGRLGGSFPSGRHLNFTPRLAEARWLTRHFPVHAMMDLSDGLAADLPRLAKASGVGFRLQPKWLPINPGCTLAQALGDGEDYELLFAVARGKEDKLEASWKQRFPALPLTIVGSLEVAGIYAGLEAAAGFDHFPAS